MQQGCLGGKHFGQRQLGYAALDQGAAVNNRELCEGPHQQHENKRDERLDVKRIEGSQNAITRHAR
ncbi:hypothetical protein D3C81_1872540 [compost metagenome]